MRIREENRNMVLLGAVTLCCLIVSGTLALFEPAFGSADGATANAARPLVTTASTGDESVRVVGAPFVPNIDPHRR